jgi:hypothetical protein
MTDRCLKFHLDILFKFQRLLKKVFYWPPTDKLYGPPYMSLQYCNKCKSQLTSPTPAQAASCCVISGTYSICGVNWG